MNNLELVKYYFELSNKGKLEKIETLLLDDIVYSSDNVGVHFGKENVMNMKKDFFGKFTNINWEVTSIEKIKNNIFEVDFILDATLNIGEKINKNGRETVIVKDGKIHFIQVRNK